MLTLDVVSWNAVISACDKGSQWEGDLELLQRMASQLPAPGVVSSSAVVSGCEKDMPWREALGMQQEMEH